MSVDYPAETYNGHPARYLTDENGAVIGFVKPNTNGDRAPIPFILAQSGVPVVLAPNGTIATNGVVTLGTALPATYSGGAWVRFPAGAVSGGSAGLYWAVFSSTTAGQVYTNFVDAATAFTPYVPSGTLTAAVGSNSAYTQTTGADITLTNITVPAGAIGTTGCLQYFAQLLASNTANNKGDLIYLGSTQIGGISNFVSNPTRIERLELRVMGSHAKQCSTSWANVGSSSATPIFSSVDLSEETTFKQIGQLATATDYLVVQGFNVVIYPS